MISVIIRQWFQIKTSFGYDLHEVTNQLPTGNHTPVRPARDAVELAVDVLSDRWTFLILREAFFGVRRYGQLQRNLGIARNVLADRLRRLVGDGMFVRVRYRTDPDWYEYRLTERALDLYPVIVGLMRWADRHLATGDDGPALELIHRSCGHPADPYLACSHCGEQLTARDIAPVAGAGPRR
jgi:DNA-binding HxlR family transcriptional regulator